MERGYRSFSSPLPDDKSTEKQLVHASSTSISLSRKIEESITKETSSNSKLEKEKIVNSEKKNDIEDEILEEIDVVKDWRNDLLLIEECNDIELKKKETTSFHQYNSLRIGKRLSSSSSSSLSSLSSATTSSISSRRLSGEDFLSFKSDKREIFKRILKQYKNVWVCKPFLRKNICEFMQLRNDDNKNFGDNVQKLIELQTNDHQDIVEKEEGEERRIIHHTLSSNSFVDLVTSTNIETTTTTTTTGNILVDCGEVRENCNWKDKKNLFNITTSSALFGEVFEQDNGKGRTSHLGEVNTFSSNVASVEFDCYDFISNIIEDDVHCVRENTGLLTSSKSTNTFSKDMQSSLQNVNSYKNTSNNFCSTKPTDDMVKTSWSMGADLKSSKKLFNNNNNNNHHHHQQQQQQQQQPQSMSSNMMSTSSDKLCNGNDNRNYSNKKNNNMNNNNNNNMNNNNNNKKKKNMINGNNMKQQEEEQQKQLLSLLSSSRNHHYPSDQPHLMNLNDNCDNNSGAFISDMNAIAKNSVYTTINSSFHPLSCIGDQQQHSSYSSHFPPSNDNKLLNDSNYDHQHHHQHQHHHHHHQQPYFNNNGNLMNEHSSNYLQTNNFVNLSSANGFLGTTTVFPELTTLPVSMSYSNVIDSSAPPPPIISSSLSSSSSSSQQMNGGDVSQHLSNSNNIDNNMDRSTSGDSYAKVGMQMAETILSCSPVPDVSSSNSTSMMNNRENDLLSDNGLEKISVPSWMDNQQFKDNPSNIEECIRKFCYYVQKDDEKNGEINSLTTNMEKSSVSDFFNNRSKFLDSSMSNDKMASVINNNNNNNKSNDSNSSSVDTTTLGGGIVVGTGGNKMNGLSSMEEVNGKDDSRELIVMSMLSMCRRFLRNMNSSDNLKDLVSQSYKNEELSDREKKEVEFDAELLAAKEEGRIDELLEEMLRDPQFVYLLRMMQCATSTTNMNDNSKIYNGNLMSSDFNLSSSSSSSHGFNNSADNIHNDIHTNNNNGMFNQMNMMRQIDNLSKDSSHTTPLNNPIPNNNNNNKNINNNNNNNNNSEKYDQWNYQKDNGFGQFQRFPSNNNINNNNNNNNNNNSNISNSHRMPMETNVLLNTMDHMAKYLQMCRSNNHMSNTNMFVQSPMINSDQQTNSFMLEESDNNCPNVIAPNMSRAITSPSRHRESPSSLAWMRKCPFGKSMEKFPNRHDPNDIPSQNINNNNSNNENNRQQIFSPTRKNDTKNDSNGLLSETNILSENNNTTTTITTSNNNNNNNNNNSNNNSNNNNDHSRMFNGNNRNVYSQDSTNLLIDTSEQSSLQPNLNYSNGYHHSKQFSNFHSLSRDDTAKSQLVNMAYTPQQAVQSTMPLNNTSSLPNSIRYHNLSQSQHPLHMSADKMSNIPKNFQQPSQIISSQKDPRYFMNLFDDPQYSQYARAVLSSTTSTEKKMAMSLRTNYDESFPFSPPHRMGIFSSGVHNSISTTTANNNNVAGVVKDNKSMFNSNDLSTPLHSPSKMNTSPNRHDDYYRTYSDDLNDGCPYHRHLNSPLHNLTNIPLIKQNNSASLQFPKNMTNSFTKYSHQKMNLIKPNPIAMLPSMQVPPPRQSVQPSSILPIHVSLPQPPVIQASGNTRISTSYNHSIDPSNGADLMTLFNNANESKNLGMDDLNLQRSCNQQLKDIRSSIVEYSKDQHGSRFIQQKMEKASDEDMQLVFDEIYPQAHTLMTDVFGNYVIQKFFEFGNLEHKRKFAAIVKGKVLELALQMYGCRVIQKALESMRNQTEQVEMAQELRGNVVKCIMDQNGNHVVQKCIECCNSNKIDFIIDDVLTQVVKLSTHPYGCRVIQRVLEHCSEEQVKPILDDLYNNMLTLVQDQYGNYVIQHVLEHGQAEDRASIIRNLRNQILVMSQHKFASNVIEKCVTFGLAKERDIIMNEICHKSEDPSATLFTMMKDPYANYVIQKMLDVCDDNQKKDLIRHIRPHIPALRRYSYGKHIINKIERSFLQNQSVEYRNRNVQERPLESIIDEQLSLNENIVNNQNILNNHPNNNSNNVSINNNNNGRVIRNSRHNMRKTNNNSNNNNNNNSSNVVQCHQMNNNNNNNQIMSNGMSNNNNNNNSNNIVSNHNNNCSLNYGNGNNSTSMNLNYNLNGNNVEMKPESLLHDPDAFPKYSAQPVSTHSSSMASTTSTVTVSASNNNMSNNSSSSSSSPSTNTNQMRYNNVLVTSLSSASTVGINSMNKRRTNNNNNNNNNNGLAIGGERTTENQWNRSINDSHVRRMWGGGNGENKMSYSNVSSIKSKSKN
ncbi:hypothetical protein SNEBB_009562 [Seison nebaliae]|nr:hypothetical protein SNEBB_009562 [Seison nebaliae]